jgi:hypothetical protein
LSKARTRSRNRGFTLDTLSCLQHLATETERRTAEKITNFESGLIFDFDWLRDGRQLAFTRGSESSDVILISNFR